MKNLLLLLALSLMSVSVAWGGSRAGVVTTAVDLSSKDQGKEVNLWIPYPVSDADQTISDVKVSGDYAESAVYTDPKNGTPILFAHWDKGAKNRKLTMSFKAERKEVIRRDFPAKQGAWDKADYSRYLAATSLGPIDGEIKKLADRITAGKSGVLAKTKAIYDWTCENTYRDPATRGCGKGDVCALLDRPGGKCTDISSVFIALCRASGIPAREIFGIRLGKKPQEDITGYQHCWAEFFVPGYGWVPADPADVRKAMLVENLKPEDKKTADYRAYFWGGIDPYRIRIAVGRDIVLNPPQAGKPLNTFGYPYAEVGGEPLDFYDPKNFSYTYTFSEK